MVDVVDRATRSKMMAGIRSKNTRPETKLRKALHARGLRYRLHRRDLPGSPDIVLPKWKVAIEVHGCFWHRHEGCTLAAVPDDPSGKWAEKFAANVARDKRNRTELERLGWRTAVVWECAIRTKAVETLVEEIERWLHSSEKRARFSAAQ